MAGMFDIRVDLSQLASIHDEIVPDFGRLQQAIINATQFVRDVWVSAVQGTKLPGMTRAVHDDAYAKSLQTGESMSFPAPLYGLVMSVGYEEGVDRIEQGYGAFDMKPGLLKGPRSKVGADGRRYNTVPFRHYTPSSNSPISVGLQMPNEVYAQAKKLTKTTLNPDGSVNWGQALDWDQQQRVSWTGYQHKNDIYHNMYRVGYQNHTQYVTFRRVSEPGFKTLPNGKMIRVGSDPKSWWHPGLSPNPVIEAVYNYCMPQVEAMLLKEAEKAFGITS
jgi:hypothetical protein